MLNGLYGHTFYPDEIAVCQRAFDQICLEGRINPKSLEAEALAATLFRLFDTGYDEATLLEMCRNSRRQSK